MSSQESHVDAEQFLTNLVNFRYREVMMALATLTVVAGSVVFFPGTDNLTAGLQSDVSGGLLALFVLVAIAAGAVKGMIGFGYALITTPIFASVIDPTLAVVVLAIPPWMLNVFQIGETDTGVAFLSQFRTGPIVPFLIGLVILGYVVFQVLQNFVTVEEAHHPVALSVAGFLQGFLLAVANLGPVRSSPSSPSSACLSAPTCADSKSTRRNSTGSWSDSSFSSHSTSSGARFRRCFSEYWRSRR